MPEEFEIDHAPTYVGPPDVADLRWRDGRIIQTRLGERRLAKASITPAFEETWTYAGRDLKEFGFAMEWYSNTVLYWERLDIDRDALAGLIDSLPDVVARGQAEDARIEDERREREERAAAERRERERAFITDAIEAARVSLRERRWSWAKGSLIDEAHELMSKPDIDRNDALRLLALVDAARKNVQRAEERTARPHVPEMERASDPMILTAARGAVEAITLQDGDWASVQNGVGWSKSTTCDGHVLAGLEAWSTEQASHACGSSASIAGRSPRTCARRCSQRCRLPGPRDH